MFRNHLSDPFQIRIRDEHDLLKPVVDGPVEFFDDEIRVARRGLVDDPGDEQLRDSTVCRFPDMIRPEIVTDPDDFFRSNQVQQSFRVAWGVQGNELMDQNSWRGFLPFPEPSSCVDRGVGQHALHFLFRQTPDHRLCLEPFPRTGNMNPDQGFSLIP